MVLPTANTCFSIGKIDRLLSYGQERLCWFRGLTSVGKCLLRLWSLPLLRPVRTLDRSSSTSYQYHSRRIPKPACLKEWTRWVMGLCYLPAVYACSNCRLIAASRVPFPPHPLPFPGIYRCWYQASTNGFQPGCSHPSGSAVRISLASCAFINISSIMLMSGN